MGNIVSEIVYSDMSIDLRSTGSWLFFLNFRLVAISNFVRDIQWRHNDHDGVSNHQPGGCLLNRLFRRRSKKTSKLRVTGLCVGKSPGPVNSPHKGPVTRKMFPFDDVIMKINPSMHTVALSILQVDGSYQPETTINLFMYSKSQLYYLLIMTSSSGNIFGVTGPLCREFTGHRWIPLHKGQRRGALIVSLICAWINGWVDNCEAGDLRRYIAHYDVIVMDSNATW